MKTEMKKSKLTTKYDYQKGVTIDSRYVRLAINNAVSIPEIISESVYDDGTSKITVEITYNIRSFESGKLEFKIKEEIVKELCEAIDNDRESWATEEDTKRFVTNLLESYLA